MNVWRVRMLEHAGEQPWGNPAGREVRLQLDSLLEDRSDPVVNLDLSGIERVDVSWSREAIAILVHEHRGRRHFFLTGISNTSIRENIDAAFVRMDMSILHRMRDGDYEVLGVALKPHLLQTLDTVEHQRRTTARRVCEAIKGLSLTACNNRLKTLFDLGLVLRFDANAPSGGREYVYEPAR